MKKTVPYITGDGVGAEITPAMQAIVNAAVKKAYGNEHEIEWMEVLAGERAELPGKRISLKNNTNYNIMPKLSIFMYPGEYRCAPTSNTTRRGDILLYIRYSYL